MRKLLCSSAFVLIAAVTGTVCSLFLLVSCAKEKQVELVFEEFPVVETHNPVEFKTEAPILSPMGMCVSGGSLILAQSVKDSIVTAFPLPLGERYSCFGKNGNGPDDFATYFNLRQLFPEWPRLERIMSSFSIRRGRKSCRKWVNSPNGTPSLLRMLQFELDRKKSFQRTQVIDVSVCIGSHIGVSLVGPAICQVL